MHAEELRAEEFRGALAELAAAQAAGALDVADGEGNTALQHACKHGVCGVAEQLLAAGAKPDTALHAALEHGQAEVALLLVEKMSSEALLLRDKKGDTYLHVAARQKLKTAALKIVVSFAALYVHLGPYSAELVKRLDRQIALAVEEQLQKSA